MNKQHLKTAAFFICLLIAILARYFQSNTNPDPAGETPAIEPETTDTTAEATVMIFYCPYCDNTHLMSDPEQPEPWTMNPEQWKQFPQQVNDLHNVRDVEREQCR